MTTRVNQGDVGVSPARQWFGIYEGRVVSTRGDLAVKAKVPQVLGQAISNWAPPMLDPRRETQYHSYGITLTPALPPGPGPGVGSRILVQFVGGDVNAPVYSLYGV